MKIDRHDISDLQQFGRRNPRKAFETIKSGDRTTVRSGTSTLCRNKPIGL